MARHELGERRLHLQQTLDRRAARGLVEMGEATGIVAVSYAKNLTQQVSD